MNLKTIDYNFNDLKKDSVELKKFKCDILVSNIIYFFFNKNECLYIGETGTSLKDRCYTHTPKESDADWFKDADKIQIIELNDKIDAIARQALEASFILAYRPKYNKKG